MALRGEIALEILDRIDDANAKQEFYLTDAVSIADKMALEAVALETTEDEVHGINTRAQLAQAEAAMQQRLRAAALDAGVTMIAPETVFLSADTKFGRDVVIEPNVVFGPGCVIEDNKQVNAYSHPLLGIQVPIVIGIGGLLLGIPFMILCAVKFREFFSRKTEVAPEGLLEQGGKVLLVLRL